MSDDRLRNIAWPFSYLGQSDDFINLQCDIELTQQLTILLDAKINKHAFATVTVFVSLLSPAQRQLFFSYKTERVS